MRKGLNVQAISSTSSSSDLININTLELFYRFPVSSLFYWTYVFTIKEADSSVPQKDRPPSEVTDPMKDLKEMFDLIKGDGRRLLPTSQHLKVSSHLPNGFIPFAVT